MSGFFQRLVSRGRPPTGPAETRLVLAEFGKHPGWDDHMPGIGVSTEALLYVKQTLYEAGIKSQVDSGAWEKLEFEKRMEGFDHIFLWQRANHVLLGQLWSSSDGKGRSKFPMVLCEDIEGASGQFTLRERSAELDRLREICQTATTAEQVISGCEASQVRLNGLSTSTESGTPTSSSMEARRHFLKHEDIGPEQLGLLRVLHELRVTSPKTTGKSGPSSGDNMVRNCHLRVPAASNSTVEALTLWSAFFQAALPAGGSILLIGRKTENWVDVIIGEPANEDFFCLCTGLQAFPLTTQIPYELAPESKSTLEKVAARFIGEEQKPPAIEKPAAVPVPIAVAPPPIEPPRLKGHNSNLFLGLGVTILVGAIGVWLIASRHKAAPTATVANANPSPITGQATNRIEDTGAEILRGKYDAAMKEAQTAFSQRDFTVAMAKANAALGFQTNDPAALQLKSDVQSEEKYDSALSAAQMAFSHTDYVSAISRADTALEIRANDPAALKLKTDAQAQVNLANIAAYQGRQGYESAMKSAQEALARQDYSSAITQAELAESFDKTNAEAAGLKAKAQSMAETAALETQHQQMYDAAMTDARTAFDGKNYADAMTKADEALNFRPNDAAATILKGNAQAALNEIKSQAEREAQYQGFMNSAQSAYNNKDYANAIEQTKAALAIKTNDPAAAGLQMKASDNQDFENAEFDANHGDIAKARSICLAHAGTSSFDKLAAKIKTMEANGADMELEVCMVRFGLLDPKKAASPQARRETEVLGELPIQQRDQYTAAVDVLRKDFQSSGNLDAAREKQLDDLKKAIDSHL